VTFALEPPLGPVLAILDLAGLAALAGLPVTVFVLRKNDLSGKQLGRLVLAAAVLLALHCLLTVLWVQQLQNVPMLLDPNPFDSLTLATLNWVMPLVLLGVVLAVGLRPVVIRRTSFRAGLAVLVIASVGFVWHAHYFFDELLDNRLAQHIWWL
jgi:hypothetical protein